MSAANAGIHRAFAAAVGVHRQDQDGSQRTLGRRQTPLSPPQRTAHRPAWPSSARRATRLSSASWRARRKYMGKALRGAFSSSRRTPGSMLPLPWQSECTGRIKMGPSVRWDDGKHHYLRRSGLPIGQLGLQRDGRLDCHRQVGGSTTSKKKAPRGAFFVITANAGIHVAVAVAVGVHGQDQDGSRWDDDSTSFTRRSGLLNRPAWPSARPAAWLRPATWPAGRADRLPSRRRLLRRPTHERGSWRPRS